MLNLYNTRSRSKQPFTPQDPARVTMYVCGPTVYNRIHIGNARPFTAFDVLFRVLKTLYPRVDYARNITDIDDKIMKAAQEEGVSIGAITARYTEAFHADCQALGIQPPTLEPRATDHIEEMHALIERLLDLGTAYAAEGHVLFAVQNFDSYGQLSNRNLEDMLEGARVEVAPYKRYAGDFVLWKPSSASEPGWDSPWGRGRPGWHLECSAMIRAHLGEQIDIHGGGRDLVFPHHENERAQSCAACAGGSSAGSGEFVNYWVHNGYVNIDGEKMSKSLGNFRTVAALLEQFPGEVIRFALLSAHYRSDMDFSKELLESSKAALDTLYGALRGAAANPASVNLQETPGFAALLDDLNTPGAIAEMHRLAKAVNKGENVDASRNELKALGDILGILQQSPEAWFQGGADSKVDPAQVEALIQQRLDARKNRDFAGADRIRQQLTEMGVVLEDSRDGTRWRLADA